MNKWYKISIILCVFGFLKEFRPSEPFIFEFLKGPWRNITAEDINQKAFPVNTYSYLSQLIIVFLITDFCRYKPLITLLGICGVVIWSMLLWTKSLLELQILEGIYGTYMATEVAYYTYMYAKVPEEYYQRVTGHARAAILTGKCVSATISQILVSSNLMDYRDLNYLTLAAQIGATLWSFTLPSVKKSIYFNQELVTTKEKLRFGEKVKGAFKLLWKHFIESYSKCHVIKWSLWWAMATCIYIQIQNYMQPLWSVILEDDTSGDFYNGAVDAVTMIFSIFGTLLAGYIKANWELTRDLLLTIISVIIGAILLITSQTNYIFVSYICYLVFNVLYQFIITVATFEVSRNILVDTHGLIFGLNTFISLILQTILTLIVINGDIGFGLDPRNQFLVYGGYFFVIAIIYFFIGIITYFNNKIKK